MARRHRGAKIELPFQTQFTREQWEQRAKQPGIVGYHARKNGVPMEIIMAKLNHASFSFTKRYLGITGNTSADGCFPSW